MTVGMLANMTRGAIHRRGTGMLIDWSQVLRRRHCDVRRMGIPLQLHGVF